MKMTVEIDCTPDEARQFCGLPDVKPLQAVVMAKIESNILEGMNAMSPESLLRAWMPFSQQGPVAETLAAMFRPFLLQQPPSQRETDVSAAGSETRSKP